MADRHKRPANEAADPTPDADSVPVAVDDLAESPLVGLTRRMEELEPSGDPERDRMAYDALANGGRNVGVEKDRIGALRPLVAQREATRNLGAESFGPDDPHHAVLSSWNDAKIAALGRILASAGVSAETTDDFDRWLEDGGGIS